MAADSNFEIKISTGKITVPIIDEKDGEELGRITFNPNDIDMLKRYEKAIDALNSISVSEHPDEKEIFSVSDEIKRQLDYLLGYPVADDAFAKCNPLTLTQNGDFYFENVLDGIAGVIEKITNQRIEKKRKRIKKAVADIRR